MNKIIFVLAIVFSLIQLMACSPKNINSNQEKMKLVYVMDPQCGWCYGNSKNITIIEEQLKEQFELEFLVGGMWLGEDAPIGGNGLSQFLRQHAPRLVEVSGVDISEKYYNLAKDSSYRFSSLEPSAATVLIKEIAPDKVFEFSKKVQNALFKEGKRLDQKSTYIEILEELNMGTKVFQKEWMNEDNLSKTSAEFDKASNLVNGFPALLLEDKGTFKTITSGYFNSETVLKKLNNVLKK